MATPRDSGRGSVSERLETCCKTPLPVAEHKNKTPVPGPRDPGPGSWESGVTPGQQTAEGEPGHEPGQVVEFVTGSSQDSPVPAGKSPPRARWAKKRGVRKILQGGFPESNAAAGTATEPAVMATPPAKFYFHSGQGIYTRLQGGS